MPFSPVGERGWQTDFIRDGGRGSTKGSERLCTHTEETSSFYGSVLWPVSVWRTVCGKLRFIHNILPPFKVYGRFFFSLHFFFFFSLSLFISISKYGVGTCVYAIKEWLPLFEASLLQNTASINFYILFIHAPKI